MTARHLALLVASLVVLGMGLYLFKEVRATPAAADVTPPPKAAPPPVVPDEPKPEAEVSTAHTRGVGPGNPTRVRPTPIPESGGEKPEAPSLSPDSVTDELAKPNPKLDLVMSEANKAYDRGDFDDAKVIALKVLAKDPANVRMLRIAVSAACIDGDSSEAQKHFQGLPPGDKEQMKVRCARYGVTFQ